MGELSRTRTRVNILLNYFFQRCKEKLNTLSISVMNQWPSVHLRVIEAWDEDGQHRPDSLHYEGRAVDVTTSDRDKEKNGMLARLAVEAGFDWVYYESKQYVHASCKSGEINIYNPSLKEAFPSEYLSSFPQINTLKVIGQPSNLNYKESQNVQFTCQNVYPSIYCFLENTNPGKGGGCFLGTSTVMTSTGERKRLSDLSVGDSVLTAGDDGQLSFSPVILFLDREPTETRLFVTIRTESGEALTLTPTHLLYASEEEEEGASSNEVDPYSSDFEVYYARDVYEGMRVLVLDSAAGSMRPSRVVSAELASESGVYAPLTAAGNLVVDNVLASCYAIAPLRWVSAIMPSEVQTGVHWYAEILNSVGEVLMPSHLRD